MRTTTKHVDFEKIQADGQSGTTVIKLMMACNDLTLSNIALSQWRDEQSIMKKSRRNYAGMYFVRTQIAHLHEGLKIIQAIKDDNRLMALMNGCDSKTKESFKNLKNFLPGGKEEKKLKKLAGRLRHNLTFHYDESGKLIETALKDRSSRPEAQYSLITRGSEAHLWHFQASDDIVNSIVVRQIWGIPKNLDSRKEADKVVDYIFGVVLSFLDFSGEFIWRYCSRNG